MSKFSKESLLKLYSIPGIGPGRMRNLISALGSPQAVLDAPLQHLIRVQGIEKTTAIKIKNEVDEHFVELQLNYINKNDVEILSFWDKNYPLRLKKIYDPPAFLFMKGQIKPSDEMAIGIVGTRVPSHYGTIITEQFSKELASNGFTIVSGFARGVDTIAHTAALKSGGRTIAVLGSGIDNIYPPENKKIAVEIIENGAIISEYPIGTNPDAGNFPRRNRIISGLSLGILITEAGAKSGALITAFQALEQNREVFATPGPINSAKSAGTNQLIKEGAKLVQGTLDILQELDGQISITKKVKPKVMPSLKGLEKTIFEKLSDSPAHVDQLAEKCKKTVPEILSVLLTLELMGVVKQLSGKMFVRM